MDEHENQQGQSTRRDAIEIGDFVYAATGARVRRLTMPDGTHWFPAVDVCKHLGYAHVGSALRRIADAQNFGSVESVLLRHSLSVPAGRDWRRDMNLVNLSGLIRLINGCTKPECAPFKLWVAEVIETIQRTGSYELEPAPAPVAATGTATAYVMPQQVIDAIVRLEERNIRLDEEAAVREAERNRLLAEHAGLLHRIADTVDHLAERLAGPGEERGAPRMSARELLARWQAKNLVVTADVHAVAAYLAPALLRGGAAYRFEEIAERTGLTVSRVHDSVRMLLKRGCMRQVECGTGEVPRYELS
ncbi:Bro-N domain-containing protein [Streptomyces sp. NPDC052225]|uniref:BRO-N domain-containing protein n=1 Tax=Streptomyces sp. NPDC052225 TaxID=3154949 RepID=UPI003428A286